MDNMVVAMWYEIKEWNSLMCVCAYISALYIWFLYY